MAVVPEALEEAAAWRAASRVSGHVRNATSSAVKSLPTGGASGHAGVLVRLIWAAAVGLVVLEFISLATGRFWTWDFGAPFRASSSPPKPYTSLPSGAVPDWGFLQASQPGAAFPHGPADRNTAVPVDATNLGSGRT